MIDTNIIEKEYDIKDSQCNFGGEGGGGGGGGLGGGEKGVGKSEGVDQGQGVVGGAYISRDN